MNRKQILIAAMAIAWLTGGPRTASAQEDNAPPKVLLIDREILKFGKDIGHEKNEAAFVRAFAAAKSPTHYLAATTMSGPSQAVFFAGFDSYAQWGEAEKFDSQRKLEDTIGPLMEKDADYVAEGNQIVATFNEQWSYRPKVNMAGMRYFELETIHRLPGHDSDWDQLVALYQAAAAKSNLDEHDIFYEVRYGSDNGIVLIFTPRKSLADLDSAMAAEKTFDSALGPDGLKKWAQLVEATVKSDSAELLEFSPSMSYPPDSWVKADPSYWGPKSTAAPKARATEKKTE